MKIKNKDWTGDTQAVMATLNASSHSEKDRADQDYYATPPEAVEMLLDLERFKPHIWEPACGEGHISEVLKRRGYPVFSSDIVARGYEDEVMDFLDYSQDYGWGGDIITNPPFRYGQQFVERALDIVHDDGSKVAMFLRIQFLEGVKRREMFRQHPPKTVYVASRNMRCARNGDFKNATGNASTYCWFVWTKGYAGEPTLRWFNPND